MAYARSMVSIMWTLLFLINLCATAAGRSGTAASSSSLKRGGFSLPLISRRDGLKYRADGFFGYEKQKGRPGRNLTAIRPPMAEYGDWSHAVQVGVGTGQARNFYMLELDLTGDVTWMQCRPSNPELPQASPIFDASMSPSYANVRAGSPTCVAPYTRNVPTDKCSFQQLLSHGAFAQGYLGSDEFAFASSSGGNAERVQGVVFGCAHATHGFPNHGTLAGVLSMSMQRTSLIRQLRGVSRFSYCLSGDGSTAPGFLRFGDDIAYPPGMRQTSMIMTPPHGAHFLPYRFRVLGVMLDGQRIKAITAGMFQGNQHHVGGCRIDVGLPVSRMVQAAYDVLDPAVAALMHRRDAHRAVVPEHRLCFFDGEEIRQHLPSMAFQLYGGSDFVIPPGKLFIVVMQPSTNAQALCLAIELDQRQTVLGVMQQLDTQFVFDIDKYKIYFKTAQC